MTDRPNTITHGLIPAGLLDLTLDYIGRLPTNLGAHPLYQALHAQVRYVDVPTPQPDPAAVTAETPKPAKPPRRVRSSKAAEMKGELAAPTEV